MTTVKINNQEELESAINSVAETLDSIVPFGQFKNQSIEDIPDYYLEFLLSEDYLIEGSVYNYLLKSVQDELKYRDTFDAHIMPSSY